MYAYEQRTNELWLQPRLFGEEEKPSTRIASHIYLHHYLAVLTRFYDRVGVQKAPNSNNGRSF